MVQWLNPNQEVDAIQNRPLETKERLSSYVYFIEIMIVIINLNYRLKIFSLMCQLDAKLSKVLTKNIIV